MSSTLFTMGKFRAFTLDGSAPLTGGKLYSYAAGTMTPKDTYTDQSGDTANANPVILDSAGQADVWLTGNYKFTLNDSNDVLQWTEDNISDTIFSDAFTGTSTTSMNIATGAKTLVTQSGKSWANGQFLIVANTVDPTNYMLGQVTDYSGTTLQLLVTGTGGSGTLASWDIALSGSPGPTGPAGGGGAGSGDVNGPGSSTDGAFALWDGASGQLLKDSAGGPGSAAFLDAGTGANQVVQLDGTSKLPAVDGSQLTNLPNPTSLAASVITSGTIATARLGSGTADATTFLRGDQTWAVPTGSTTQGGVGTYVLAKTVQSVSQGGTTAGSGLTTIDVEGTTTGGSTLTGTWRLMSASTQGGGSPGNLWARTV